MVGLMLSCSFKCGPGLGLCRYLFTKLRVTVPHLLRFAAGTGQGSTGFGPMPSRVQWLRKTDTGGFMGLILRGFPGKINQS